MTQGKGSRGHKEEKQYTVCCDTKLYNRGTCSRTDGCRNHNCLKRSVDLNYIKYEKEEKKNLFLKKCCFM